MEFQWQKWKSARIWWRINFRKCSSSWGWKWPGDWTPLLWTWCTCPDVGCLMSTSSGHWQGGQCGGNAFSPTGNVVAVFSFPWGLTSRSPNHFDIAPSLRVGEKPLSIVNAIPVVKFVLSGRGGCSLKEGPFGWSTQSRVESLRIKGELSYICDKQETGEHFIG